MLARLQYTLTFGHHGHNKIWTGKEKFWMTVIVSMLAGPESSLNIIERASQPKKRRCQLSTLLCANISVKGKSLLKGKSQPMGFSCYSNNKDKGFKVHRGKKESVNCESKNQLHEDYFAR